MFDFKLGDFFGIFKLMLQLCKFILHLYVKIIVAIKQVYMAFMGVLKKKSLVSSWHILLFGCLFFILPMVLEANKDDTSGLKKFGMYAFAIVTLVGLVVLSYFAHKFELKQRSKIKIPKSSKIKLPKPLQAKLAPSLPIESVEPHGVFFGKKANHYIIKPEELDGHVLVVGGVGTGKSSCVAIPTLRNWNESVFAIDIKGELYEKTKNQRDKIQVFNPMDENSYGYDPFFCLKHSQNRAQDARAIALALIPLPLDTKEPFWIESAQNIFTAAILHYSAKGLTFLDTIKEIQKTTPKSLIKDLCDSPELEVRYFVNSFADADDKTLASIMSELSKNIVYFITDKNLASALSRENNITPLDLEFGNDVYINIPEHLLRQWKNLLTLIVNQFLNHFEQRTEANARPILFLLDEFPRLGKINSMLDGLATLRSKKIIMCLIIQSLSQLDVIYGHDERKIILDTCAYKAILGATDADTQEYFSRLVGTYDKLVASHSTNNDAILGFSKGTSTSTQEQEKRIIKPHEFGNLKDIVLLAPLEIPFERPKEESAKSAEQAHLDRLLLKDLFDFSFLSKGKSKETVSFCRVEKIPYYLTDEEQNANL